MAPFQRTVDPATKFAPFTVRVNPAPPAVAEAGMMLVRVGTGLFAVVMVKVAVPEVPPPGAGLDTVTPAVPAAETSEFRTSAVSRFAETYRVVRADPCQ